MFKLEIPCKLRREKITRNVKMTTHFKLISFLQVNLTTTTISLKRGNFNLLCRRHFKLFSIQGLQQIYYETS